MGSIATGAVCGSVPLYRLYNPANGDHLYTISAAEVTSAEAGGYTLEFTADTCGPRRRDDGARRSRASSGKT